MKSFMFARSVLACGWVGCLLAGSNPAFIRADETDGNRLRQLPDFSAVDPEPPVETAPAATKPRTSATVKPRPARTTTDEALACLNEAYQLSQSGSSREDFTQLIELCEKARQVELGEQEVKYARDLLAWGYNRRGELLSAEAADLLQQGDETGSAKLDQLALVDFNAAVNIDPSRWKAIHNRGVSFGLLGRHEDALADFTRVLELKTDYANAWFNRAEVNLETGRFPAAIRDYGEALKLVPTDAAAFYGRGRAHALAKKYAFALEDFAQAIELEPTLPEYRVERGELHMRLGDWKNAAADFRHAIEMDPENARAYRSAAWLMATCPEAKFRNAKLAVEAAEKAVSLAENAGRLDYTYLDVLAAASANAGQFVEAHDILREALAQSPSTARDSLKQRLASYAADQPFRMRGRNAGSNIRTVSTSTPVRKTR